jgi:hypothetical protein
MTATLTFFPELTFVERCDRCGADAKVRVVFPSAAELLFCGHHARRYKNQLLEVAVVLEWSP